MKGNKSSQYARALLLASYGKTREDQKKLATALSDAAGRRGERGLLPHILKEVRAHLKREEQERSVHIEIAHNRHDSRMTDAVHRALPVLFAEGAPQDISVSASLIGGFRIRYRDTVYDASYRKHLLDLYRRLVS